MRATIIISVYKNVEALRCILASLERQTRQDFEVIISEDGECAKMAAFVEGYHWPWPYQHLTQADEGWRKNRALNRAVAAAHEPWLIFIDGDCVLHERFVEWHLREAERHEGEKVMIGGKRVKLNPELSQRILDRCADRPQMLLDRCAASLLPRLFSRKGCRYVEEAFYMPICRWLRRPIKHLVGSNMSMSKAAIEEIGGFDEWYTRPATGEDYDIEWRLQEKGYRMVSLRNLAVQYHLWHRENWLDQHENVRYCSAKRISIIISFYNKIDLLKKILEALSVQTMREFEVVIADDGSREEVVAEINRIQNSYPFAIQHVWHKDKGWRKNAILNKAVVAARGEYLIFLDGDCLPERHFVEEHYAARSHSHVVTGRRVLLTEKTTARLLSLPITRGSFGMRLFFALLGETLCGKKTQMEQMIRLPQWMRQLFLRERVRYILGCNFSLYKSTLLSVNGFDERFEYPGYGEDIDLEFRLSRMGIPAVSRKCQLVQFHCYHQHFDTNYAPNKALLEENTQNGVTYTQYGINPDK